MAYKTPGVYVEEISLFPPSVAEVETAIPAFIGYTQMATYKGEDLTNKPTKIGSLLEYKERFGGGHDVDEVKVIVDQANSYAVQKLSIDERFYMYESLRLYFDNGGGDCYIVSVGNYGSDIEYENEDGSAGLRVGLDAVKKFDEPTILLFPDAVLLEEKSQLYTLQQKALKQCADLMDRVAVFDLDEVPGDLDAGVKSFRDAIGINNLKYGAAYAPWLLTSYPRTVGFSLFSDKVFLSEADQLASSFLDLKTITSDERLNGLVATLETALGDQTELTTRTEALKIPASPTLKDHYAGLRNALNATTDIAGAQPAFSNLMAFVRDIILDTPNWPTALTGEQLLLDLGSYAKDSLKLAVHDLLGMEKNEDIIPLAGTYTAENTEASVDLINTAYEGFEGDNIDWLDEYDDPGGGEIVADILSDEFPYGEADNRDTTLAAAAKLDTIFEGLNTFVSEMSAAAETHAKMAQEVLYENHSIISNIVENIKREFNKVPPSGAIAGIYAGVDDARGVWKAPANVSVSSVSGPTEAIDFFDQEDLNIDVNAGKSINAIRAFSGRGTIVWGARTLAGNDNEWRYIPVRRFFNMVEESVKKSTVWAVFEPNAAPLWTKVKGMIENYLIQKWRQGALAGATPEEAFYVRIGLGETMMPQDILEGRLIVEIGMAVVRPAEFIVLKFMHKLQE